MSSVFDLNADAVKAFDLHSRGAIEIVQQWKTASEVRDVWKVEDLIAEYSTLFQQASQLLHHYQQHGTFPISDIRFSYFADSVERLVCAAQKVDDLALAIESTSLPVAGASELRKHIAAYKDLLGEDRLATDTFFADSLSDWTNAK